MIDRIAKLVNSIDNSKLKNLIEKQQKGLIATKVKNKIKYTTQLHIF